MQPGEQRVQGSENCLLVFKIQEGLGSSEQFLMVEVRGRKMASQVQGFLSQVSACQKHCHSGGKLSITGGIQVPFRNVVKGTPVLGARLHEILSRKSSNPKGPLK